GGRDGNVRSALPPVFRAEPGAGRREERDAAADPQPCRREALNFAHRGIGPANNQVNMRIESKAPTRVDLAGGTLDIWPIYLFHPGAVTVNAAITRYASCRIETQALGDVRIRLVSRDTQREESFASFAELVKGKRYKLPLLAEIVKFFQPQGGFTLTTDSEAPAGAGIGGSSAMAV